MIIKQTNGLTMDRNAQIDKIRYRIDNLVSERSFVMQADFYWQRIKICAFSLSLFS